MATSGFNINGILRDIQALASPQNAAVQQVQQTGSLIDSLIQATGIQDQNAAGFEMAAAGLAQAREADKEANVAKVYGKLGLDLSDPNSEGAQLASILSTKQQQLVASMMEADDLRGVKLLENPLQWLFNQFALEDKQKEIQALAGEAKQAAGLLRERSAIANDQIQAVVAMKGIKSQAERDAILGATAQKLQSAVNRDRIKDLITGTQQLKDGWAMSREQLDLKAKGYSLRVAEEERQQNAVLRGIQLQNEERRRKDMDELKADKQMYQLWLTNGAMTLYGKDARFAPMAVLEKDELLQRSLLTINAAGSLGPDPYTAISIAKAASPVHFEAPWRWRIRDFQGKIASEAQSRMITEATAQKKQLTDKEIQARLPDMSRVIAKEDTMKPVGESTLHGWGVLGTYGNYREIQKTGIWQEILGKFPAHQQLSDGMLLAAAMQLIKEKKLTTAQAAQELSTIAKGHQYFINEVVDPMRFAIPRMEFVTVKALKPSGAFGGGTETLATADILNPGNAKGLLDRLLLQEKLSQGTGQAEMQESLRQPFMMIR